MTISSSWPFLQALCLKSRTRPVDRNASSGTLVVNSLKRHVSSLELYTLFNCLQEEPFSVHCRQVSFPRDAKQRQKQPVLLFAGHFVLVSYQAVQFANENYGEELKHGRFFQLLDLLSEKIALCVEQEEQRFQMRTESDFEITNRPDSKNIHWK